MRKFDETLHLISTLGINGLLEEVRLSPKPGLVDAYDQGAHQDMDIALLEKSAYSFQQGFYDYLSCGYHHQGDGQLLFEKVRRIGIENEATMFRATNGINTHKGANFSFGLVLSALGFYLSERDAAFSFFEYSDILATFNIVKAMAQDLIKKDFKALQHKADLSYGERLYLNYGFAGIRQEAEAGYPIITELALPRLLDLHNADVTKERAYHEVLFTIMAVADDSNIINRGGFEALDYVKEVASEFLAGGGTGQDQYQQRLEDMNLAFIARNLSPGGSADLLALTIFLGKVMGCY